MLLVKTTLSPSALHGHGLIADEQIEAGAEVWRFEHGFDLEKTADEISKLPPLVQDWFKHFGYLDHHFERYILSFDNARFINHSDNPNVKPDYSIESHGVGIAQRIIKIGEELTINYRDIEHLSYLDRK